MELESSNLIKVSNSKQPIFLSIYSYEKDIKFFVTFLHSILGLLNIFIIFIIFALRIIKQLSIPLDLKFLRNIKKDLSYYQNIQNNFCDNFRNLYNKDLEDKIALFNVSLNSIKFDMFLYKNYDYQSWKNQLNHSFQEQATLHMLNALKYYTDKYNYKNEEIIIFDSAANIGWYTYFFGLFNYNILSFEPFPDNFYILKKNYCRNRKNFFSNLSTVTVINKALYSIETSCDYYRNMKNYKKNLLVCDKKFASNIEKDYIKIGNSQTSKLSDFISLIRNKQITLIRIDLENEGEKVIEGGKEIIIKYHIPFILIEFNKLMFALHETKPQDFLRLFTENGYKISLNGFLSKKFISVEELIQTNFVKIILYIIYAGT